MASAPSLRLGFVIAVLLASCSSSGSERVTKPIPLTELAPYRACQTDDQCVWVTNGCCDCANGGEDIAVARDKQAAFRKLFSCDNVPCTEVDREPPCGTGALKCERGLCVFHSSVK